MRNKKRFIVYMFIVALFNLASINVFAEAETMKLHGRIVKLDKPNHTMVVNVSDGREKTLVFDEETIKLIEKQEIVERDFVFIKYKQEDGKNVIIKIKKVIGC
ncbi:MAG: hypothetical protein QMD44_06095 [Thermodesulfovibrionales bacterium]|jgi:hypothetical protein|nr:hypothetical protein [Thermodesulfovibrionales bacterium]